MALKIEDYIPPIREAGLNTDENVTLGGTLTVSGETAVSGASTITSTSANALAVGANGTTNPVLKINASTASVATGVSVTGAAAAGGVAVAVISSGTNENLTIDAKGSGTITLNATGTGDVAVARKLNVMSATATPAGGTAGAGIQFGTTSNFGIFYGSGAPTLAAAQGSLYLRSDGSSTSTRAYINTNGSTTWTAITTAA